MVNINWQPGMTLEIIEEHAIKQAYNFFQRNKSATCRALDISVRTLEAKLEKYAKDDEDTAIRMAEIKAKEDAFFKRQRGLSPLDDISITREDLIAKNQAQALAAEASSHRYEEAVGLGDDVQRSPTKRKSG